MAEIRESLFMDFHEPFTTVIGTGNSTLLDSKPNSTYKGVVDIKKIEDYILECIEIEPSLQKSNIGGFQSIDDFLDRPKPFVFELKKFIVAAFSDYAEFIDLNKFKIIISNSWANVNHPGNYNTLHNHPGAMFSGCYYIRNPKDAGIFSAHDPRIAREMCQEQYQDLFRKYEEFGDQFHPNNRYAVSHWNVNPRAGDIVIFPSWLKHEVTQNKSDRARISIAFNIYLERVWKGNEQEDWFHQTDDTYAERKIGKADENEFSKKVEQFNKERNNENK
jgi:uncharacterized protein (TIGR02466 family)